MSSEIKKAGADVNDETLPKSTGTADATHEPTSQQEFEASPERIWEMIDGAKTQAVPEKKIGDVLNSAKRVLSPWTLFRIAKRHRELSLS